MMLMAELPAGQRTVTVAQFARFRAFIEARAGIHLADTKMPLLAARLGPRVRELALRDFGQYLDRVVEDDAECIRMLDRICTNETQFFREPHHFDLLANRFVPQWLDEARRGRRHKRVTVWSAGCSTGEEPYSVAILLRSLLEGWDISILATDLSTRALDTASAAIYPAERCAAIPPAFRSRSLLRGVAGQAGKVKIAQGVRACVRFERVNLTHDDPRVGRGYDLVLCRNVMIYFRANTRHAVLTRLTDRLAVGGRLFLGHAETLPNIALPLRPVIPTVYEREEVA